MQVARSDDNEVTYVVVEDTKDSSATQFRKIYGLNAVGRKLREVLIDNPASSPKYWCSSWKLVLTSDYTTAPKTRCHITEFRPPSAHDVTGLSEVRNFLNPFNAGTSSWTNDTSTLRDKVDSVCGPTTLFTYNSDGRVTGTRVKRGYDATDAYYVTAVDYGDGSTVPVHYPVAFYSYPTPTITRNDSIAAIWQMSYSFWDIDKTQLKKSTTTYPTVSTGQNGSGATTVTAELWYDQAGRLRWAKNAEGYITYYSYHKTTGRQGYTAVDVNPGSAPTGATDSTWVSWNDDGTGSYNSGDKPTRGTLPTVLALVTRQEYDILGRPTLLTNPGGDRHYTLYETSRTIEFPYLNGSHKPQLPTQIRVVDNLDQITDIIAIRGDYTAINTSGDHPTGFSTAPDQDDYVSWTRFAYDDKNGNLAHVDQYHDIPAQGAGDGTISTNFTRMVFQYDVQNRRQYTIQQVAGAPTSSGNGVEQVTQLVYDRFGRVNETKRGVSAAALDMGASYNSYPTLATVSKTFYDGGDATTPINVGDGHVTSTRSYFGTGSTDFLETNFFRDFRGHLRAIQQKNNTTAFPPYTVQDVDWRGRPIDEAQYTSNITDFVAVANDPDYVSTTSTGRNHWTRTRYDALGSVYQIENYPGTETTNRLVTNSYYDRMGRLVCTGDKYGAHVEYAYDGAGRQYESRTVKAVSSSTPYSSGAFVYNAPVPNPDFSSLTSGNGGVIELSHTELNSSGSPVASHTVEINHNDTNGISLSSGTPTGGVRRTVYSWFDGLQRLTTMADFGVRDDNDGDSSWAAASVPTRPGSEPTASTADMLVSLSSYEAETGRLSVMTDPGGTKTKTFYDDAGRRLAVAENFVNYSHSAGTGAGGGTNNVEDRVTKFTYNGLGQQTLLTAVNVTSAGVESQETKYYYQNAFNASLLTHTVYPDSSSTPSSGTDLVTITYNLDGSPATKTDQREVVITYAYNTERRLKAETVTSYGSSGIVDNTVQAITHAYDDLGQPLKITSHGNATDDPTNTSNIKSQIVYTRDTQGHVSKTEQSHSGAVTGGTLAVDYAYDTSVTSSVYNNGLRPKSVTYPKTSRKIHTTYSSSGTIADLLNRADMLENDSSGSPGDDLVLYAYNGTSRMVETDYTDIDLSTAVRLRMYAIDGAGTNDYNGWDRFGRIKNHEWRRYRTGSGVRDRVNYTNDAAGNRLTRDVVASTNDTRDQKYAYDGLQRLLNYDQGTLASGSIGSSNKQRSWKLDQLGNWPETFTDLTQTTSEQVRAHNAVNEITTIASASTDVAHDLAGNLTKLIKPAWSGHYALKYDAWNRLVEVKDGANVVQANSFDGLGRRIVRGVYASGTLSYKIHCYYDEAWQLLEERKEPNGGAEDPDPLNQYVWHPYYIDALAVRWYDASTSGTATDYFALHDANFNVTTVVDQGGTVVERYAYSPYGEVTVLDANYAADADGISDIGNTHLYTGREKDLETGLQLNRHRAYSSWLGRWLNRDPIGYKGSQWNLYEYVGSRPINELDLSGTGPNDDYYRDQRLKYDLCLSRCPGECVNYRGDAYIGCRQDCAAKCDFDYPDHNPPQKTLRCRLYPSKCRPEALESAAKGAVCAVKTALCALKKDPATCIDAGQACEDASDAMYKLKACLLLQPPPKPWYE